MASLKWSTTHAVFIAEIDDEHKVIFEALSNLQKGLDSGVALPEVRELTRRVVTCATDHFAHEERLMRASRYDSAKWHKKQHDHVRRRVRQLTPEIENGETEAGAALIEYVSRWLPYHARIADRMLGAFLRNQRRMCTITFGTGTKPLAGSDWVDSNGDRFDPNA